MNILTNMQKQNPSGSGSLPSNTVANPRGDVKAITTIECVAYDGPLIPPTPSPSPKEVECETEATKDKVQSRSLESTAQTKFQPRIDDADFDPKGDLLLLEKLLNNDPSSPLPPNELHFEGKGTDKLPVIISKELKDEEKAALFKILKSHKGHRIENFDTKWYRPRFVVLKEEILMEDDFKPAIQHQRRVNLKIHEVIKKEVIKLLDAGLIYPISDSPWVSPVYCVPKKGGMTVVENKDNELIPTRLVTGWRVCIDYRKLNDATRKDHFPLPFMDQMLERLAGNEYYCFLDGFSGYF
ncbi:hypothetical protein Tco_0417639 [Tanacetum coccineum]